MASSSTAPPLSAFLSPSPSLIPSLSLRKSPSSVSLSSSFSKLSLQPCSCRIVCRSTYNVQVIVAENEHEERLVNRFRREVLRAGIIQESKRRKFFENSQEKRKRKTRDAARRNRKRRPPSRAATVNVGGAVEDGEKKKKGWYDEADDNWELPADVSYIP